MTARQHTIFWLGFGLVFLALVWVLSDILTPFVLGIGIAYFLDPLTDRVEQKGASRSMAAGIVLLVFLAFLGLVLALTLPVLFDQFVRFFNALPSYVDNIKQAMVPVVDWAQQRLTLLSSSESFQEKASGYAGEAASKAISWGTEVLQQIWSGGSALFNLLSILIVTPVVAFYLLRDWDLMLKKLDGWLPRAQARTIRGLLREMNATISGFLRGQALVCIVLGLMYAVSLSLVGLDFGFFIGMMAGVLSFIPYVGSLVGFVVAILVCWFQFGDIVSLALVSGIFGLGQFIEGNFLTPKLVGEKIGLHAVWVLFALMAGGSLLGFVGVMIAVPVAAVIGVMVRFALQQYLNSPYYTGRPKGKNQKTAKKTVQKT